MPNRVMAVLTPLLVLAAAHVALGPPRRAGIDRDGAVDPDLRERLEQERPELVMLGSSHLNCGFDPDQFTALTGTKTVNFATPGANTAWHFTVLKNCILPARHHPKRLGILFVDTDLAEPGLGTRGWFKQFIDRYATNDEPVLDQLAYYQAVSPLSRVLLRYSSLYQRRDQVRDKFESEVKRAAFLARLPQAHIDEFTRRLFADEKLADDLATLRQLLAEEERSRERFAKSVDRSFLPHLVRLAEQGGMQLFFVRLQVRREIEGNATPEGLDEYMEELRAWLDARGIPLIDTTGRAPLHVEHYAQGNHLTPEGMAVLTAWLANTMEDMNADGSGASHPSSR